MLNDSLKPHVEVPHVGRKYRIRGTQKRVIITADLGKGWYQIITPDGEVKFEAHNVVCYSNGTIKYD